MTIGNLQTKSRTRFRCEGGEKVSKKKKKKKASKMNRASKKPVSVTFLIDGKELFTAVREMSVKRF